MTDHPAPADPIREAQEVSIDTVMRVAHNLRREAKRRDLTGPEVGVMAADLRLRDAGWTWGPDGPIAPKVAAERAQQPQAAAGLYVPAATLADLRKFLDVAAGEGYEFDGVDAGDLYAEFFGDPPAQQQEQPGFHVCPKHDFELADPKTGCAQCNAEQPATSTEQEKNDVQLASDSDATSARQQRGLVGKVAMGQPLGEGTHPKTSNLGPEREFALNFQTGSEPTPEQIEAGAKALAEKHWHWDRLGEKERDSFRERARGVLLAAQPPAAPPEPAEPPAAERVALAEEARTRVLNLRNTSRLDRAGCEEEASALLALIDRLAASQEGKQ